MNKIILFGVIFFLAFATSVNASLTLTYNKTQNTLGNSIWNETFAGNESKTFYVNLPKNATVSNAKLNLSGNWNYTNYIEDDVENSYSTYGYWKTSKCQPDSTGYGVDEKWGWADSGFLNNVPTDVEGANFPNWFYEEYNEKDTSYLTNITWASEVYCSDSGSFDRSFSYAYIWNYSANNWSLICNTTRISTSCQPHDGTGLINCTSTLTNVNNYWNSSNKLKINTTINSTSYGSSCGNASGSYNRFYFGIKAYSEGEVKYYNRSYPINPSLDVANDGDNQWSFSGNFNQTNNQTSDFSSEINSYLKNCYPYTDGTCDVPFILHSDSAGIMQVKLNATITYDSQTFDSSVYEGQTSNFWVKVNSTPDISNVNAWLVYNGTSYAYTTKSQSGSYWTFTKTLTIPSVNADANISFYWNFTYSNATSTYAQNFSSNNQTVYVLSIYNCSSGNVSLNFTGYNEETNASMNYDIEATFTYWISSAFSKNMSFKLNNSNNYLVCIAPSNAVIYSNATIKYSNSTFSTRYYYLQSTTLTNSTSNIKLYLLSNTSSSLITITVYDELNNPKSDIVIQAMKQNVGLGTYTLVAEGKSDFSGLSYIYLKLHEIYKFLLMEDGVILREYEPMQLETTTLEFHVSTADVPEYFSYYDKVATSCSFNNASKVLTCTYADTSGLTMDMLFNVTRIGIVGETSQCTLSSSSPSGSFTCTLSGNYTYKYNLVGKYYSNPLTYLWQSGFIDMIGGGVSFGAVGLFLALILVCFLPLTARYDIRIAVILTAFGIIFSIVAGLIRLQVDQMAVIFSVALISGAVAWRIKS